MKTVWQAIADFLYGYGSYSAGAPSIHGCYEPSVPEQLRKKNK